MNKIITLLLTFFLCFAVSLEGYQRPNRVDSETWEMLTPYFLPEDHPIKPKLDAIFKSSHLLNSTLTLRDKGFKHIKQRRSEMVVASHPKLKGYKVKLFLNTFALPEWWFFKKRLEGAHLIQAAIDSHEYGDIMTVPKKWIYPLPETSFHIETPAIKNFILIVEDVHIYKNTTNAEYYRTAITKKELFALFTIIRELNLFDSVFIDNIPRCLDQRFAFIDTEHFHSFDSPIPWQRLLLALNSKRRDYLQGLIDGAIKE